MTVERSTTRADIVDRLKARRELLGKKQQQVAQDIGVSEVTLWRWENGKVLPSREHLEAWAAALGARLYWSIDMVTTEVPQ